MKNMTISKLTEICQGTYFGKNSIKETEAEGIALDSRKIERNWIFVATKGERVDGHSFIPQVVEKGVLCVVSEQEPDIAECNYILVEDSFLALKRMAAFYRQQLSIKVVGITGSVGKTSTKEMIASVLSQKYSVLKTQGNFNNEVGLPLTVFSLRQEHEVAVLEMGISNFGEMHRLAEIAVPDICVITNIGESHLENLKSREGILKAKTEVFDQMNPEGEVVLNGDDDMLCTVKEVHGKPVHYFSKEESIAGVFASDIVERGLLGTHCKIHTPEGNFDVHVPLPGAHMVNNALAAVSVGLQLDMYLEDMQKGIEQVEAVGGRSHIVETEKYVVIDDCYNANPVSMKAAIDLLSTAESRKVAVLGSMFELGENEQIFHKEVGQYAAEKGISVLIAIGELAKNIYDGFGQSGVAYYYETVDAFLDDKNHVLRRDDAVLVKASNGMHFSRIVDGLVV